MWKRWFASLHPSAVVVAFFAFTFPLWSNAYLSPPDSASYFCVPRSIVGAVDLDFYDDYSAFAYEYYFVYLTEKGHFSNDWPMGSGVVWLPVYAMADVTARLLHKAGIKGREHHADDPPRTRLLPKPNSSAASEPLLAPTGQSGIYKLAITLLSALFSMTALWLGLRMARVYTGNGPALAAVFAVLLGTPVGFYTYSYAMMSHVNSMFAVGLVLWLWNRTRVERTLRDWAVLGALAGLMVMIRPQDGAFLGVFLVEVLLEPRKLTRGWFLGVLVAAVLALLAFSPQMILWWKLYGNPLQLPKIEEMHWLRPRLYETLFSQYHGVLSWSPVIALVPLGLVLLWRRDRVLALGLAFVIAMQVYLNAANEIWWAGGSFGNRRMVNCGVPFVIALAAWLRGARPLFTVPVVVPLAGWNLLLWAKERAGELSLDHFVPWDAKFFSGVLEVLNPWKFFVSMLGDFAGFGWPVRLVVVALLLAVAWAIQTQRLTRDGIRCLYRPALAVGAFLLLAMPCIFLLAASRTASYTPEELPFRVLRENRSLFNGYYEYGFYNLVKGRDREALAAYRKAVALVPTYPTTYRYLAMLTLDVEKDPEKALEYSGEALDIRPDYEAALREEARAIAMLLDRDGMRSDLVERLVRRLRAAGRDEEADRVSTEFLRSGKK